MHVQIKHRKLIIIFRNDINIIQLWSYFAAEIPHCSGPKEGRWSAMRVVDESARLAGLWRVSVGLQDGAQALGHSFSQKKRDLSRKTMVTAKKYLDNYFSHHLEWLRNLDLTHKEWDSNST